MKYIKYLLVGVVFGIIMSKSEIISWYRIYEMFRFESFHMYGVIGSAIFLGGAIVFVLKRTKAKSYKGEDLQFCPKSMSVPRYLFGGIIFGLGWAMTGACPGPMFVLLGKGIMSVGVILISAVFGTFLYGVLRSKLPH